MICSNLLFFPNHKLDKRNYPIKKQPWARKVKSNPWLLIAKVFTCFHFYGPLGSDVLVDSLCFAQCRIYCFEPLVCRRLFRNCANKFFTVKVEWCHQNFLIRKSESWLEKANWPGQEKAWLSRSCSPFLHKLVGFSLEVVCDVWLPYAQSVRMWCCFEEYLYAFMFSLTVRCIVCEAGLQMFCKVGYRDLWLATHFVLLHFPAPFFRNDYVHLDWFSCSRTGLIVFKILL